MGWFQKVSFLSVAVLMAATFFSDDDCSSAILLYGSDHNMAMESKKLWFWNYITYEKYAGVRIIGHIKDYTEIKNEEWNPCFGFLLYSGYIRDRRESKKVP